MALVQRRAGGAVPGALLARLLLTFGGLCAGWYGLQRALGLHWIAESVLSGLLFVGLLFLTGVVRAGELRAALKAKG